MKHKISEALVGAAVLIIAAWFLWFTSQVAPFGKISGYELHATFDKIDGITIGSDVMLGGIKVGSVLGTHINPDTYQAVVRFSVTPSIRLPADSSVEVSTQGLLGVSYLSLKPGGEASYLVEGDEVEFTQGSVDIIDLVGKAMLNPKADTPQSNSSEEH